MSLTVHIPTLETERLILRAPRADDYDLFAAFMATDRAAHVGGPSTDWAHLRRMFAHIAGLWVLRGFGPFMLDSKETGALQGMVALWEPIGWPEPELGWSIWAAQAEGKGFAYEAALKARSYMASEHGIDGIVSYIAPGNDRSIALAERLGAHRASSRDRPPGAARPCSGRL